MSDTSSALEYYKLILEDMHRWRSESRATDTMYRSMLLVLLGAEAYLAVSSTYRGWVPVVICAGISVLGVLLLNQWQHSSNAFSAVVGAYVDHVTELERNLVRDYLPSGESMIFRASRELGSVTQPRYAIGPFRMFLVSFLVIPCALALTTILAVLPATHAYVAPLLTR